MAPREQKVPANLVIGVLLVGPLLFVLIFGHFLGRPEDELPRAQLEQQAGILLPRNCRGLHSLRYGFDTKAYYIRFEVPQEELDGWLTQAGFAEQLAESPLPKRLGAAIERSWWDPPPDGQVADLGDRQAMIVPRGREVRVYLFVKRAEPG